VSSSQDLNGNTLQVEQAVRNRYSAASQAVEPQLCCPVNYETKYLAALPQELIDRDYGCGDPSKYVQQGETVLDLGSGGGKICYIASQIVGPEGAVYGVDMNDDMLALARQYQEEIAGRIGWNNVHFRKGRIQDLALDLDALDAHLKANPAGDVAAWMQVQEATAQMREQTPMIPDNSIDVVLSNCVLNLVSPEDRRQMFSEIFRVLKRGGRAVISDIVSDEYSPEHLRQNPELWSGCISGAFEERDFLTAFEEAGFYGVELVARQTDPWMVVEGIEFRSATVRAFKGKEGPCTDHHQAVIYKGPWKKVYDDDGHVLHRGARMAVCEKTFDLYTKAPYAEQVIPVAPQTPVAPAAAKPFNCQAGAVRDPQQTKGKNAPLTMLPEEDCCSPEGGCC